MRCVATFSLIIGLMLASTSPSFADDESKANEKSSEELAIELLELTGGVDMAHQVMQALSAQMRPLFPSVPEDLWNQLIGALDADELSMLVVPIYTRHYSNEDLRGLLEFYRAPLGQRLLEANPAIMQESMAAGGAWGQQKAAELIERLRQEGFTPTQI